MAKGNTLAKIALITGASKGLGFALAQKLSAAGYTIILNARTAKDLEAAHKQMPQPAVALAADASDAKFAIALQKLMLREKFSHLDLVVHSAAINHMGTIKDTKPENAAATFQANAFSVISLAQATRSHLEKADDPRFVLVSSLMQYFSMPGRSVYAASKAAAEQFAGAWAHELKAEGSRIRVKIFRPAGIQTGFHANTKTDGLAPRSEVSRMSADDVAGHLERFIDSGAAAAAPGAMNKAVAFVARHFPGLTNYLVQRRYRRKLRI
jgi:short-subunit dehydrogenase